MVCPKRQLWRKMGWLILTLLAPDMAIYTAWFQRREALKKLKFKAEKRGHDGEVSVPGGNSEEWGMKHAFYAIMGGFVIDVESEAEFLPGQRKSMALTAKGIQNIAERFPALLPDVSEAEMRSLSIGPNKDGQLPAAQVRSQPTLKKIAMSGQYLHRSSAAEQLSCISPMKTLPWRSDRAKSEESNEEQELVSIRLGKGDRLVATSIRNEYGDINLKQKDIRRWQMAENLLIEDLSKRVADDDWQATISDRSKNWPSIDVDPNIIDWSLLSAFNISGILHDGLHVLAWNARFATNLQGGL